MKIGGQIRHLLEAPACCAREHDLKQRIRDRRGGNGRSQEQVRRCDDWATRRSMAELIREARREHELAVERIEPALAATGEAKQ